MKIHKGPAPEGFYICSHSRMVDRMGNPCFSMSDDIAIQISFVELDKKLVQLHLSPEEAIELGECMIKVSKDFLNGIETGLDELED